MAAFRNHGSVLPDPVERASEEALIAACRRGDREALTRIFRREGPALARLLGRMAGGDHVDDLLQITFAEAITAFPRFRGDSSVKTWLSRIAVNVVRQSWRKKAARRRAHLELVPGDEPAAADAGELATARRQLARVHEHLVKIGEKKRLAFALHVIDGRPIDEVAALMGATVAATRSRVFWARRALKAKARRDPVLADWIAPVKDHR